MVMLLVTLMALMVMKVRSRGLVSHLPLWHLALVLVACGLAFFINPYGARLIYLPLEMCLSSYTY